jgi:hypothetical protein
VYSETCCWLYIESLIAFMNLFWFSSAVMDSKKTLAIKLVFTPLVSNLLLLCWWVNCLINVEYIRGSGGGGARCPWGQCARRAIAEARQHSQRSVIGWVPKICYLALIRASEGTFTRWSRLHLQSLVSTTFPRRGVLSSRWPIVKNNCNIFIKIKIQKHVLTQTQTIQQIIYNGNKNKKIKINV